MTEPMTGMLCRAGGWKCGATCACSQIRMAAQRCTETVSGPGRVQTALRPVQPAAQPVSSLASKVRRTGAIDALQPLISQRRLSIS